MKNQPFELHVTVEHLGSKDQQQRFRYACEHLGVKALEFCNISRRGISSYEHITAEAIECSEADARARLQTTASSLSMRGLRVTRQKIESPPWHPAVPKATQHDTPDKLKYFEAHTAVGLGVYPVTDLVRRAASLGMFVSQRIDSDKEPKAYATFRQYGVHLEDFAWQQKSAESKLSQDFEIQPADIEYSLFDSSPMHDVEWMKV